MNHPDIAAPLAAALAAKGYASLTTVQQSVLAPEAHGADLLVSAQTGSGKTVAFGLAMAPEILDGRGHLDATEQPLALAIAPTRELALQVAAELGWLYAQAGAQIATCVGGMDYRTERRALARGAHIVVGTPGRLRDHIERGSLDLSALRVAVLDEADEMLDLGFREDLEFILSSASDNRRTLMFSATVPPAIEALARDFQQDAMRISAAGEARQHGDIEYRALSVLPRDREHAIFNLLRFYEARTAIIFCKTRAEVNHLLARMGNRGFRVVALSGELSQQERMHALQALRDGRARVCIATDVAARGIDLPGLELVIHADLPTSPDTLLHRSGRTGRAGAKGVSALIVTTPDQKRAQSLLRRAKVVAEWGSAPSADEVQERDNLRMLDHLAPAGDDEDMAADLVQRFGAERVASAFIRLWREGRPAPEELAEQAPMSDAPPRKRAEFGPSVWFVLKVGYSGRAEARWLLPKICEAGQITRDEIGAIRVKTDDTFVQIAANVADRFNAVREIGEGIAMHRIEGEPVFEPARQPYDAAKPVAKRKPRTEKPAYVPKAPRFVDEAEAAKPRARPVRAKADAEAAPAYDPAQDGEKPRKERWSTERRQRRDSSGNGEAAPRRAAKYAPKPAPKTGGKRPPKSSPKAPRR